MIISGYCEDGGEKSFEMIYIDFQRLCHILIRLIIHHHIDVFNEQVSQHPLVLFIIRSCEIIGPEVNLAVYF